MTKKVFIAKANVAAIHIQKCFRFYLLRRKILEFRNEMACRIQRMIRAKLSANFRNVTKTILRARCVFSFSNSGDKALEKLTEVPKVLTETSYGPNCHYTNPGVRQNAPQFVKLLNQHTIYCTRHFSIHDCILLSSVLKHVSCKVRRLIFHGVLAMNPCYEFDLLSALKKCISLRTFMIFGGKWNKQFLVSLFDVVRIDNPRVVSIYLEGIEFRVEKNIELSKTEDTMVPIRSVSRPMSRRVSTGWSSDSIDTILLAPNQNTRATSAKLVISPTTTPSFSRLNSAAPKDENSISINVNMNASVKGNSGNSEFPTKSDQNNAISKVNILDPSEEIAVSASLLIGDFFTYSVSGIQFLSLHHMNMTNQDLFCIAKTLQTNSSLTTLCLSFNFIEDSGLQSIMNAVIKNSKSKLEVLDLHKNFITLNEESRSVFDTYYHQYIDNGSDYTEESNRGKNGNKGSSNPLYHHHHNATSSSPVSDLIVVLTLNPILNPYQLPQKNTIEVSLRNLRVLCPKLGRSYFKKHQIKRNKELNVQNSITLKTILASSPSLNQLNSSSHNNIFHKSALLSHSLTSAVSFNKTTPSTFQSFPKS